MFPSGAGVALLFKYLSSLELDLLPLLLFLHVHCKRIKPITCHIVPVFVSTLTAFPKINQMSRLDSRRFGSDIVQALHISCRVGRRRILVWRWHMSSPIIEAPLLLNNRSVYLVYERVRLVVYSLQVAVNVVGQPPLHLHWKLMLLAECFSNCLWVIGFMDHYYILSAFPNRNCHYQQLFPSWFLDSECLLGYWQLRLGKADKM